MRTLFFSPRIFWPVNSGARIRDYFLLRALACHADVTFFGICQPDEVNLIPHLWDGTSLHAVRIVPKAGKYSAWNLLRGFCGPIPINVLNYADAQVARELQRLLREEGPFDVVQVEGIHLASYLPLIRSSSRRPLVVCDWHDVESDRMLRYGSHAPGWAQRLYAARTARLLRKAEQQLLSQCDVHLAVSHRDQAMLQRLAPQARIEVLENGVDVDYYAKPAGSDAPPQSDAERRDIIFVGSMDFHANIDAATWFAAEVWPGIRAQLPQFRFVIVGSNPVAAVLQLGTIPGVTVTGTVDDVRPYYASAFAAVVPLRIAGGTRLKILEAMAAGVPVISTAIGAEGLAAKPDEHFFSADTPEAISNAIGRLQSSPSLWLLLSRKARELVQNRYNWADLGNSLYQRHCAWLEGHD